MVGLFPDEIPKSSPPPGVVHGRDIGLFRFRRLHVRIQFFRLFCSKGDLFKGIHGIVIDTAQEAAIESLYHHHLRAFPVAYLAPLLIHHAVIIVPELDGMATVYRPFRQDCKDQVDFFRFRLHFKDGSAILKRKCKLCVEFFYVGV